MKRGRHDFVVGNRRLFGSRGAIAGGVFSVVILAALNVWGLIPPVTGNASPQTRTFTLTAEEIDWELQPGNMVRAWAYNGQVPGPEIRIREGDRVQITMVNHLPVA